MNYGGSNGKIINNTVRNTLADAIHNTEGAHDIIIANNTVRNAADDMIAMVSYGTPAVRNILVQDNDVAHGGARGITSIGSSDITIQVNKIDDTTSCCAGILVATEPAYASPLNGGATSPSNCTGANNFTVTDSSLTY